MSTISGTTITSGIVVGTSGNYTSPLTISSTGAVIESSYQTAINVSVSQATIVNDGKVSSHFPSQSVGIHVYNSYGISLHAGGVVTNASSGYIGDSPLYAHQTYYGISIVGGAGTVLNAGTISVGGYGIALSDAGTVLNTGAITSKGVGIRLENGGYVENAASAVINGYFGNTGELGIKSAGAVTISNAGSIRGSKRHGAALRLQGGLVENKVGGQITGYRPIYGYGAPAILNVPPLTVVNHGIIQEELGSAPGSAPFGIYIKAGGTVINSGTVIGQIYFGNGPPLGAGTNRLVLQNGYSLSKGYNLTPVVTTGSANTLELSNTYGAVTVDYSGLSLNNFQHVVFDAGGSETLKISNTSGTFGATISGFITNTQRIDLTAIGTDGVVTNFDSANNMLTVGGSGGTVSFRLDATDGTSFTTTSDNALGTELSIACFCRGTLILTPNGEAPVEDLAIGDWVMTFSGTMKPIRWIGRRAYDGRFVSGNPAVLPIRLAAGSLGGGVPTRDLYVSPEHALVIDGLFLPARLLVNGATIVQCDDIERIEYFHIELDTHDVILAEGAAAESFSDFGGRGQFHNADEFARLYPHAKTGDWETYAALLDEGKARLPAVRAVLLDRALRLGRISRDPDLHLIVDGNVVRAERAEAGIYRFALPAGVRQVALASRSTVPEEAEAVSLDPRRLGVPLEWLVLKGDGVRLELMHDCDALRAGFHADEGSHRWTDGHGTLPSQIFRCFTGATTLEVQIGAIDLHYPTDLPSHNALQPQRSDGSVSRLSVSR